MNTKKIIYLLLLCLSFHFAVAQNNSQKAYIDSLTSWQKNYVSTHEVVKGKDKKYFRFYKPTPAFGVLSSFEKINDSLDNSIEQKKAGRVALWNICKKGEQFSKYHPKGHYFADYKLNYTDIVPTITASVGDGACHPDFCRLLNRKELCRAGTYPQDYDFKGNGEQYLIGMSVPPVMVAQIAKQVYEQWLSKI